MFSFSILWHSKSGNLPQWYIAKSGYKEDLKFSRHYVWSIFFTNHQKNCNIKKPPPPPPPQSVPTSLFWMNFCHLATRKFLMGFIQIFFVKSKNHLLELSMWIAFCGKNCPLGHTKKGVEKGPKGFFLKKIHRICHILKQNTCSKICPIAPWTSYYW
jgi:hypothetical protein